MKEQNAWVIASIIMLFIALGSGFGATGHIIAGEFNETFWKCLWTFIAAFGLMGFFDLFSDVVKYLKRLADAAAVNQPPAPPPPTGE